MLRVLSFGEILIDFLSDRLSGGSAAEGWGEETFRKFAGGAPANVAVAVARLGGRAAFVGALGRDAFADFLFEALSGEGVETGCIVRTDRGPTALAFVSLDRRGERTFTFYRRGTADLQFRCEHLKDAWFALPGLFHFCSNTLAEAEIAKATLAAVARAREAGFVVSFDVNFRPGLWPRDVDPQPLLWRALAKAHVVKVSREDAPALSGEAAVDALLERIVAAGATLAILTDGGEPVRFTGRRHRGHILPPAVTAIDATAAGDAFMGGLLFRLAALDVTADRLEDFVGNRRVVEEMLGFAAACGAHAVTCQGAFAALPRIADLATLLARSSAGGAMAAPATRTRKPVP